MTAWVTFIEMLRRRVPCRLCYKKKTRLKYPGACSLEFQSVIQILTQCLLKWDTKRRKSTGQGILGTVLAFFGADEEQGRKTLHRHWQIWIEEMNQTLRNSLFDNDPNKRKEAQILTALSVLGMGLNLQSLITARMTIIKKQQ